MQIAVKTKHSLAVCLSGVRVCYVCVCECNALHVVVRITRYDKYTYILTQLHKNLKQILISTMSCNLLELRLLHNKKITLCPLSNNIYLDMVGACFPFSDVAKCFTN